MQIGHVSIDPPLVLGPMAGYTMLAFRVLCRRAGAGLVTSEMISARALEFGSTKTLPLMQTSPREHPVALQIFGGEPDSMADAARRCVDCGADLVDLNLGCTVPKVRKAQAGVGLMCDAARAVEVAAAVVQAVPVPVTVKYRSGLTAGDDSFLELGRRLQDVGVAALTLHARPASAYMRGRADWGQIARLAQAVRIPVIGNGDVREPAQAPQMLKETGCAGVMIARGALGRPWLFRQAAEALAGQEPSPDLSPAERLAVALCHAQMLALHYGDEQAAQQMRGQIGYYTRGMPDAARLRQRCQQMRTLDQFADLIFDYLTEHRPDRGEQP
jgi:nifR3 family TIM-barrel protein